MPLLLSAFPARLAYLIIEEVLVDPPEHFEDEERHGEEEHDGGDHRKPGHFFAPFLTGFGRGVAWM